MKNKKEAHLKHLKALKNVRSTLNNSQPKKYSFLDFKAKAIQSTKCTKYSNEERNF
jgi:hypothetical protein